MDILPFRRETASLCMGLDEALLEARTRGEVPDTLRFFQFQPSSVSVGYFQSLESQINIKACKDRGIDYVRRITGGGSVFHDNRGEITYSVVVGAEEELSDYSRSYEVICQGIVEALGILGLQGEFKPVNDVLVSGKKISGSAQTRRSGVILQHGTFMYDTDLETLSQILNVSNEKLSDKFVKSVKKRVTTLKDENGIADPEPVLDAMRRGFEKVFGKLNDSGPDAQVLERARELAEKKYSDQEYLFLR